MLQVCDASFDEFWIVLESAGTPVAACTQEASDLTCGVIVINLQMPTAAITVGG